MLTDFENKAVTPRKNPHLAQVAASGVAVADAEKSESEHLDAFLLANAAASELGRRSERGEPVTAREAARARKTFEEAQSAYARASTIASEARGRHNNAQRAAQEWEVNAAYWRSQAEQRAAETPVEKSARERREQYQRDQLRDHDSR